jgi:mono/diheme cytochrome c family protein
MKTLFNLWLVVLFLFLVLLPARACTLPYGYQIPTIPYQVPYYQQPYYQYTKVVTQPVVVPATVFQFLPAFSGQQPAPVHAPGAPTPGPAAPALTPAPATLPQTSPVSLPVAQDVGAETASRQVATSGANLSKDLSVSGSRADLSADRQVSGNVVATLSKRCASCHTGQESERNFQIFSSGTNLAALNGLQKARIALRARRATMPPAAKGDQGSPQACSDVECEQLDAWAEK